MLALYIVMMCVMEVEIGTDESGISNILLSTKLVCTCERVTHIPS